MKKKLEKLGVSFVLILTALFVLLPFYWMIATSLKSELEALRVPPTLYPRAMDVVNYARVLELAPFLTYFLNTLIVSLFVVMISTTLSILAAFAFARFSFPGKGILFFVVLATMMIPQEMLIITNFMTVARLGWLNTYKALILPFCVNAFNIYLLRQSMMQIPDQLYIAARIDGLSNLKYLLKVVIPQTRTNIITVMILSLIWIWNTYAWPTLITTQDSLRLVSNGLKNAFTTSTGNIRYELQMAAATMVTIPLILLFVCLRKYILSGMQQGGIKG